MKSKWNHWYVLFIFVLLSGLFFYPYFTQRKVPLPFNLLVSFYSPWKYEPGFGIGVPNKPLGDDNLKLFYPYRTFTIDQLKAGRIPLWNPYAFSGSVNHAMYQSAVFYPLNFFYFIFPQADAWSLIVMSTPVLSGWFMYLFLRSLKLSSPSSIFGSVVFAFSGWMMAFWEEVIVKGHTILWLPLALYASNLVWEKKTVKGTFLFILAVSLSALGGFPQMFIYFVITLLAWNLYKFFSSDSNERGNIALRLSGALVLAILLVAFQWVPAIEAFLNAPRGNVDTFSLFEAYLTPLPHLVTFLAPDFWGNPGVYNNFSPFRYLQEHTIFIGIPGILLTFFALLNKKVPSFWKVFSLVTLSMGFALPTSWLLYTLKVPLLNVALPVRIFILATFGFSVLAAYGLEHREAYKKNFLTSLPVIVFFLTLLMLWGFSAGMSFISKSQLYSLFDESTRKTVYGYATVSVRNLVFPSIIFAATVLSLGFFKNRKLYLTASMTILTIAGAFLFAQKILYFSDRRYEYPPVEPLKKLQELSGLDRVWSYGDGYVLRNIPSFFRLFSPEGYEALYSYRYGMFLNTIQTRGILTNQIQRTDATLSETGQFEKMTDNPVRLRLMAILGVKYVLERKDASADQILRPADRFPPELFALAWQNDRWRIWEYKKSVPRTFVAYSAAYEKRDQKIIDTLLNSSFDINNALVVEERKAALTGEGSGESSIISYQPSNVTIRTQTKKEGLLFLSDTYYPGWRAYVDGYEQPIYRADFVFRAVPVPAGSHTVRFVYDPLSWKLGLYISGFGLGVLALVLFSRNLIRLIMRKFGF